MPLALPLRLVALLHALRLPDLRQSEPRKRGKIDLCVLPPYLRRDIGFETFRCETREDWRTFR
ncbi:hypothetical protein [Dongia sp.]|uniref:hypothetical protein n=1 Tax=Dongia sp. TaxID=1977262 RepID=UPI0037507A8A